MSIEENSDQAFDLNKLNAIRELKRYFTALSFYMYVDNVIRHMTVY